jgi:putative sterol carrier protein
LIFEVDCGEISIGEPASDSRLIMNTQTLAKIYAGYLNVIDAWNFGKVRIDGNAVQLLSDADRVFSPLLPFRSWIEPG